MPQGSDASWVGKLYSKCTKWDRFSKPKFGENLFCKYNIHIGQSKSFKL